MKRRKSQDMPLLNPAFAVDSSRLRPGCLAEAAGFPATAAPTHNVLEFSILILRIGGSRTCRRDAAAGGSGIARRRNAYGSRGGPGLSLAAVPAAIRVRVPCPSPAGPRHPSRLALSNLKFNFGSAGGPARRPGPGPTGLAAASESAAAKTRRRDPGAWEGGSGGVRRTGTLTMIL